MSGSDSSCWPAATTGHAGAQTRDDPTPNQTGGTTLAGAANQWPTPNTAPEAPNGSTMREGGQIRDRLTDQCLASVAQKVTAATWPTPAVVMNDGEQPETWLARAAELKAKGINSNGAGMPLTIASLLWATPSATDDERGTTPYTQAELDRPGGCPKILSKDVAMWATPAAAEEKQGAKGYSQAELDRERGQPRKLSQDVLSWPTPNSRDHKGRDLGSREGGASLSHYAEQGTRSHSSPQAQVTSTAGDALSPTAASTAERLRLNPAFVCWLMGWPWWWTRAECLSFAARETALWRLRLQRHLYLLCGEPNREA
jgi:hypothetical protein